jgi:hypothetical protein
MQVSYIKSEEARDAELSLQVKWSLKWNYTEWDRP